MVSLCMVMVPSQFCAGAELGLVSFFSRLFSAD